VTDGYNAAERRDVRRAEKADRLWEKDRHEFIRGVMALGPGRRWILEVLELCHIFRTTFSGEALTSAFAEGERNVGLRILGDVISSCPDQYIQMMREKNARDSTGRSARADDAEPGFDFDDDDDPTDSRTGFKD
jgi:hypothetical protein